MIEDLVRREDRGLAAHDFKHVDRVRRLALAIAAREGYKSLEAIEAAALLHDVGLARAKDRRLHGEIGANIAAAFLLRNSLFSATVIEDIAGAVRNHNSSGPVRDKLSAIIRDADILDLLGAVGVMRAFISKSSLLDYDSGNIKGKTWKKRAAYYDQRLDGGLAIGESIVDQINFQISRAEKLTTITAKKIGGRLVRFMKDYLEQLEAEVDR